MTVSIKRLLKLLSSVGEVFSVDDLAVGVGLSRDTVKRYVREMMRHGLVTEVDGRYTVTGRARLLLEGRDRGRRAVDETTAYIFTDDRGLPIPIKIDSLEKLYIAIKYRFIPLTVAMEHISKGYLTKWISEVLGAKTLAEYISKTKTIDEVLGILEEYLELSQ